LTESTIGETKDALGELENDLGLLWKFEVGS